MEQITTDEQETINREGTIIGDIIIGETNPTTLTEDEFNNSPNLLFHGAAQEFNYSPEGDYDQMNTGGDGTTDYGAGFYTTDSQTQATNYSLERSGNHLQKPLVYSFLPHNARMLDVRDRNNLENNGVLPREFTESWLKYLRDHVNDKKNFANWNEFMKNTLKSGITEYFLGPLQKAFDSNQPVTIRGDRKVPGIFGADKNGLIDSIFQNFMLDQGYAGMIYREGGEGVNAENLTGYIFYDYRTVDTCEGWKKRSNR